MVRALWILPLLASAAAAQEDGRKNFASCASCHVAPDRTLAPDRRWIESIMTSA
ncbi:MAG: hypothetical protein HYY17_00615 [Planctomycetes bacterium]|nr:hypothetical protein [Planctomycetota bacterium]